MTDTTAALDPRTVVGLKQEAAAVVDRWRPDLFALSDAIHRGPELAFEEHDSCALVADLLTGAGFRVTIGAYGLATAVEAVSGDGGLTVAICGEYDALPNIGHACGHNLIAAAGAGAAIALASVAHECGLTVRFLGTPAEERGGGKVLMLERGAWEGVDLSLMAHGASGGDIRARDVRSHAVRRLRVCFNGKPAHAASAPHHGVNAGDAATISLTAIGLLRQQLRDEVRISAVVAVGGDATNIVPAYSEVHVEVRALSDSEWRRAIEKVLNCFAGGALATGCTWRYEDLEPSYAPLRQDPALAEAWDRNLTALGRTVESRANFSLGSTDMGNVSQVVRSLHPVFAVPGAQVTPHTQEFAALAATQEARQSALDAAKAMAWTVIDEAARLATAPRPVTTAHVLEGVEAIS